MKDILEVIEEGTRLEAGSQERAKHVLQFNEKFNAFVGLITNRSGMSRAKREYLMKEAETTSDFPALFGTVLERSLIAKYQVATADWRTYIKTGTQNDFRPQRQIGVWGLQGKLSQVKQRQEYKQDSALTDGKVDISLAKYGREFPLAWESVINDDLGAFSDIAERLANAALRTEWYQATSLIAAAAGPNTALFGAPIVHPVDGGNVTNKFTGVTGLTADNLGLAASAMRRQLDQEGEPILIDGFELVVPPALEYTMLQVLNPANIIMSGGDATAGVKAVVRTSANVTANLNITGHVNAYLPSIDVSANKDKTWYLFAKLSSGYAARLNFLRGHENPEIVMKNPNKVSMGGAVMSPMEGDFESDSLWWRLRHIMGGGQIDPRFATANVNA